MMSDTPVFAMDFTPPDISGLREGNCGVDYVTTMDSGLPGPHVVINAVTHGNEPCGAVAICALRALGVQPVRGRLTLTLANVAAYRSFSAAEPFASRYVDEDFNRIWRDDLIDSPRLSQEAARARLLRPIYAAADVLLDLHSMSGDSAPMILCGRTDQGRRLARRLGYPGWIIADDGHRAGPRLIDYAAFTGPSAAGVAILVECGQHWRAAAAAVALETSLRLLHVYGLLDPRLAARHIPQRHETAQRMVAVTHAVTAAGDYFTFSENFTGLEIIAHAGTVIGFDGATPVTTPYDQCVLVMPTRHVHAGQTAVRFGRIIDG